MKFVRTNIVIAMGWGRVQKPRGDGGGGGGGGGGVSPKWFLNPNVSGNMRNNSPDENYLK